VLDTSFAFLLPTVIMLAIVAVESAARQLAAVRLQLLAETSMLERLVARDTAAEQAAHIPHEGRPYTVKDSAAAFQPLPPDSPMDAPLPIADGSAPTSQQYACPNCGRPLSMGKYAAARRYGHCAACKEQPDRFEDPNR
jgi:hypothetical protein